MSFRLRITFTLFPIIILLVVQADCSPAFAQLAPGLGYAFPPVAKIGETTSVQLGGFDLTPDVQWFIHRDDVTLEIKGPAGDFLLPPPPYWVGSRGGTNALPIPREVPAAITVNADAQPGFARFQTASANGTSKTAVLLLSRDTEVTESRSRDLAQRLPSLPVGVSGRLGRLTEVDRYVVTADRDEPITIELLARKLGSDFRALIQVHDSTGRLIADFADTYGVDGELAFMAKAREEYTVSIHDADFRGDYAYVYHLKIGPGARPVGTLPSKVQKGLQTKVTVVLKTDESKPPVHVASVVNVPGDHTSASIRLPGDNSTPGSEGPWRGTVAVPVSSVPQYVETDLRFDQKCGPGQDVRVEAPCGVSGQLHHRSSCSFVFAANADENWQIHLTPWSAGTDLVLKLFGDDGKLIAENDDYENSAESRIVFRPTVSGSYRCVVDVLSDVSAPQGYYLELSKQQPDFSLSIPQQIQLPLGGTAELNIQASRLGGMSGEIPIEIQGLPAGVSVPEKLAIAADQSALKVALSCAADSAVVASAIQVKGSAMIGDQVVTRTASAAMAGVLSATTPQDLQIDRALLAITMAPPIEVLVVDRERQRDVPRGSTYLAELQIVRKEGFQGEVTLIMSAQQARNRQGIRGQTTVVPPDQSSAFYPCFMPEWLATDITRRMVVHGIAVVPDPKGTPRYLTKPGDARITMIMEGALMKLGADVKEFESPLGGTIRVPITISRTARLPLPVTVDLQVPEEARGQIKSAAVMIPADQQRGVLQIDFDNVPELLGPWTLRLAATALQDGRWPVVSETEIKVDLK
jgi:hypothetical protein